MSREETTERVREMRERGMPYWAIGKRLGISASTAWRYADPANAESHRKATRRWNQRNRGRLSAAHRRRRLSESGRPCRACKALCEGELCRACFRERHRVRMVLVARFWQEGLPGPEIASRLNCTTKAIYGVVSQARKEGFHLPYRQRPPERASS